MYLYYTDISIFQKIQIRLVQKENRKTGIDYLFTKERVILKRRKQKKQNFSDFSGSLLQRKNLALRKQFVFICS